MSIPSRSVFAVPLSSELRFTSTYGRPTPPAAKFGAAIGAESPASRHPARARVTNHSANRARCAFMVHLLRIIRPRLRHSGPRRHQTHVTGTDPGAAWSREARRFRVDPVNTRPAVRHVRRGGIAQPVRSADAVGVSPETHAVLEGPHRRPCRRDDHEVRVAARGFLAALELVAFLVV